MVVKLSIVAMIAIPFCLEVPALPSLTIRYDDEIHRKLKIIAATKGVSLNALFQGLLRREVDRWEAQHGLLRPIDENSQ
jgi:hypothetical protein